MLDDFRFETFVDTQDGAFAEYISSVIANIHKGNLKYREIEKKIDALCEQYPTLLAILDMEKTSELSMQECKAFIEISELKSQLHDIELEAIYFRGCYDSVGYLKKAGIL